MANSSNSKHDNSSKNDSSSHYILFEEAFESPPQSPGTPESISPPSSMAFRYEEDPKNLHKAAKAAKATSLKAHLSANDADTQRKAPAKIRPKKKGKIPLDTAHDTDEAWTGKRTATSRKDEASGSQLHRGFVASQSWTDAALFKQAEIWCEAERLETR